MSEIASTTSTLRIGGDEYALHTWNVHVKSAVDDNTDAALSSNTETTGSTSQLATQAPLPKGIVVVYHGLLAHGLYPTVRYAAELVAQSGYAVFALDMLGHGKSPGKRGYIESPDVILRDGVAVAVHAHEVCRQMLSSNFGNSGKKKNKTTTLRMPPMFLLGSSLGGATALAVSHELTSQGKVHVDGLILLAPMLAVDVPTPLRYALRGLAFVMPSVALIGSSASSSEDQYRDPQRRKECDDDELSVKGKLCCATALTCVELTARVRDIFKDVKCPFLCMVATEDRVVDNRGALELIDQSPSTDKTMKKYDALHGLLCEPEPLVGVIHQDLLDWLEERTKKSRSRARVK